MNFRFKAGRDIKSVEKAVLPAIIYINTNHSEFTDVRRKGFMIVVGWWDWSIKFGIIK